MRWNYPARINGLTGIPRRDYAAGVFFWKSYPVFYGRNTGGGRYRMTPDFQRRFSASLFCIVSQHRIAPHKKKPGAQPGFKKDGDEPPQAGA